jgi:hypothetical protein
VLVVLDFDVEVLEELRQLGGAIVVERVAQIGDGGESGLDRFGVSFNQRLDETAVYELSDRHIAAARTACGGEIVTEKDFTRGPRPDVLGAHHDVVEQDARAASLAENDEADVAEPGEAASLEGTDDLHAVDEERQSRWSCRRSAETVGTLRHAVAGRTGSCRNEPRPLVTFEAPDERLPSVGAIAS